MERKKVQFFNVSHKNTISYLKNKYKPPKINNNNNRVKEINEKLLLLNLTTNKYIDSAKKILCELKILRDKLNV